MIETIIFDIGNVLVKVYDDDIFYNNLMQRFGVDERLGPEVRKNTSTIRWFFGLGMRTESRFYKDFLSKVESIAGFCPDVSEKEFYDHWNGLFLGPNGSMVDVVNQLKERKYSLQILSNISRPWLEFVQKNYPHVFAPFDDVVASCDVSEMKGDGLDVYEIAHRRNGAEKASNCIFIDDKLRNVLEAREYGFNAFQNEVLILGYEQSTERFKEFLKVNSVLD